MIITMFNIFPIVFFFVLKRYRKKLADPLIRKKFGQMYETIDVEYQRRPRSILGFVKHKKSRPDWGTLMYPIIYLLRRTAFVMITFLLFKVPGI